MMNENKVIMALLRGHSPMDVRRIEDETGLHHEAVTTILSEMRMDDRIEEVGNQKWVLTGKHHRSESDGMTAKIPTPLDGFKARVVDGSRELLIQGGPGGYQLDAWWEDDEEDNRRFQSNNWVRFGENAKEEGQDNRHTRDGAAMYDTDREAFLIFDPDPRSSASGYTGAEMYVSVTDEGFNVWLEWEDSSGVDCAESVVVPFIDPRMDREAYYEAIS